MPNVTYNPNTLGEALSLMQGLLGDPNGKWVTLGYALPFLQTAYSSIATQIKIASGKNLEALLEVTDIPAGTSDLSIYQDPGDVTADPPTNAGPLASLYDPIKLWAKSAGSLPGRYALANGPRDTLPFINPPGIAPGTWGMRITWAWIGGKLSITPVAGDIDIQVYGRCDVPTLSQQTDKLVLARNMGATLALSGAALAGVERTNPAILAGYADRANANLDNIVADIILQSQREPRRLAKMGGHGGNYWGWA